MSKPRFKVGDSVRLRDDVEYDEDYNNLTLREGRWAVKGEKYTVSEPEDKGHGYTYLLNETGFYVGEDALEPWVENDEKNYMNPPLFPLTLPTEIKPYQPTRLETFVLAYIKSGIYQDAAIEYAQRTIELIDKEQNK